MTTILIFTALALTSLFCTIIAVTYAGTIEAGVATNPPTKYNIIDNMLLNYLAENYEPDFDHHTTYEVTMNDETFDDIVFADDGGMDMWNERWDNHNYPNTCVLCACIATTTKNGEHFCDSCAELDLDNDPTINKPTPSCTFSPLYREWLVTAFGGNALGLDEDILNRRLAKLQLN